LLKLSKHVADRYTKGENHKSILPKVSNLKQIQKRRRKEKRHGSIVIQSKFYSGKEAQSINFMEDLPWP
jgi:hypothetical protein